MQRSNDNDIWSTIFHFQSMQEDINPSNPGAVPKMAQQRKGYDLVVPLPFYRCGYPDNTHLTRFDAVVKASSIKRPQVCASLRISAVIWQPRQVLS